MVNNHISHSQISDFIRCNLKWKLGREAKERAGYDEDSGTWAQKGGKVIHTVMEMLHSPSNRPRALSDIPIFLDHAREEVPLKSPYLGQVKRTITHFTDTFGLDPDHVPDHTELEFTVPLIEGCDLAGVFDDVTFDHKNKEVMIGEWKSSLKDQIDVDEIVWMTYQPFVYQYAAGILWPDYTLTAMQYTLLTPKMTERVIRPMWQNDIKTWEFRLKKISYEMMELVEPITDIMVFPNYSWNCKWCPFWSGHCQQKLLLGGN